MSWKVREAERHFLLIKKVGVELQVSAWDSWEAKWLPGGWIQKEFLLPKSTLKKLRISETEEKGEKIENCTNLYKSK